MCTFVFGLFVEIIKFEIEVNIPQQIKINYLLLVTHAMWLNISKIDCEFNVYRKTMLCLVVLNEWMNVKIILRKEINMINEAN